MPDRLAKFPSTIFASLLAGAALATLSHGPVRAADECLSSPKDETPDGSHWYYRIDHATKRHCWYLREEGEKASQTTTPNSSRSAKPTTPKDETATQLSIANAHAELPAQTSIEQPNRRVMPVPAMPADAAVREDNAAAPDATTQQSVVATRWPESSELNSTVSLSPAMGHLAENTPPNSVAVPPTAVAAVPLAAADSSQVRPATIPMLLSVMTGALALAGITASAVIKFGGARRSARLRRRRDRLWQSTDHDRIALSVRRGENILPRRPSLPRDLDRTGEANDRVADFYSQLSNRTPS
jgi:hypothetical protein